MIFTSTYTGQKNELYKKLRFKGWSLCDKGGPFVFRSLKLTFELYCKWLNDKLDFFLIPVTMRVPGQANVCSESLLDALFCEIQFQVNWRVEEACYRQISFVWTTEVTESVETIYQGYLFIRLCAFDYVIKAGRSTEQVIDELKDLIGASITCIEFRQKKAGYSNSFKFSLNWDALLLVSANPRDASQSKGFIKLSKLTQVHDRYTAPFFRVRYGFSLQKKRKPFVWPQPQTSTIKISTGS